MQETGSQPLSWEEFSRVEMRVGRIVAAVPNPKARKAAYKLEVDLGPLGLKRSSAQITELYTPEELVGRLVVAVVNFPPRKIAGFNSEVLVLGVDGHEPGVVLLQPERDVPLGSRVY